MRAKFLKNSLFDLFEDVDKIQVNSAFTFIPKLTTVVKSSKKSFTERLIETSWIKKWQIFNKGKIEKIEPKVFAEAFIEVILQNNNSEQINRKKLAGLIDNLKIPLDLKEGFKTLLQQIDEEKDQVITKFKEYVESWYSHFAEHLKASYKNHIRKYLFISGLIIAITLNVDSIYLTKYFHENPQARQSYVSLGQKLARDSINVDADAIVKYIRVNKDSLSANGLMQAVLQNSTTPSDTVIQYTEVSSLPLGMFNWSDHSLSSADGKPLPLYFKIIGLFITGLALSFGSPYWFDVLRKLVKLEI